MTPPLVRPNRQNSTPKLLDLQYLSDFLPKIYKNDSFDAILPYLRMIRRSIARIVHSSLTRFQHDNTKALSSRTSDVHGSKNLPPRTSNTANHCRAIYEEDAWFETMNVSQGTNWLD